MSEASAGVLQVRELAREGMREFFVTAPGGRPTLQGQAALASCSAGATILGSEYFGPGPNGSDSAAYLTPITWVQGCVDAAGLGGLHLRAVADVEVRPLVVDGEPVGTVVTGPYATECLLSGLRATDTTRAPELQARETFERLERVLATVDMDFGHVARTWLFLDDILSWYGEFNSVRTTFFTERGVFDKLVPASTGIGGSNPFGAAMIAGAYAVKASSPEVTVQAVPSPLQCPAPQYGSSFSRAVEVSMPDLRRLFVSGTASIEPGGKTAHLGDVVAQTALTCDVVAAILESRGMGWEDVTRATAYVRHAEDAGVFEQHCAAAGLPPLPVVVAHNVICRDDLLFELEVDAVQARA